MAKKSNQSRLQLSAAHERQARRVAKTVLEALETWAEHVKECMSLNDWPLASPHEINMLSAAMERLKEFIARPYGPDTRRRTRASH